MWIREVEFPAPLLEAHRAGNLVIFVGAGASRDAPSNLPDFLSLARGLAAEAQMELTSQDEAHLDAFMGRIADRQFDAHRRVAFHIGDPTSLPNRLHAALVNLAVAPGPVRIVTTNYDRHLSTALRDRNITVDEYAGPALPMGDDFTGIVYLHGTLSQDARRLVVTDSDFGRAYLRDAWAARFLERMFATYTVLFVGYSHGDVVMRYLARALGPGAHRYVLIGDPEAADWRSLGLLPISYPVVDGSHAALTEAVQGWASQASMGLLDHRQRIAELVAAPPPQVPEEASYMEDVVADPERVGLFTTLARGEQWLFWAAAQPKVRLLFDPSAPRTDCSWTLASWFAEHYVLNEDLTSSALDVLRDAGWRLGPMLWAAIGQHLHIAGSPRPAWPGRWLVLLIQNAPEGESDWLVYALSASRWPQDSSIALLLFDHLTEPQVTAASSFRRIGGPRFDVELRGSHHELRDAWQQLFVPSLAEASRQVLVIVDRHLRNAYQLLSVTGSAYHRWDPISLRRSAIARDPEDDGYQEAVDVLIDAARDCLEALLDAGDALALSYADSWADSEVPILRRLALHGWQHRTDVDDTAKIAWLRERGWLFEPLLRCEVLRLLRAALPGSATGVADALVADALAGPSEAADSDQRAYEQLSVLAWIKRHAPELESGSRAFEQIHARYPHFMEREHPEHLLRVEVGFVRPRPPMSVQDLHESITAGPPGALATLRGYENATFFSDGPRWEDALSLLVETVREHPADGFAVLDATGGDHPAIISSVISGWSTATVDAGTAETILERLLPLDATTMADPLSRLLADGGQDVAHPTEWYLYPAARRLAAELWSTLDTAPPTGEVTDWLQLAINHPAGHLAQFWVHVIAADWRTAGDQWAGIPSAIQAQLEAMLATNDARAALAEVMVASQVHFFSAADHRWCETHVLPLLDWADPVRARRTWDGYLTWGRWNDHLLSAGLLKYYLAAINHLDDFRADLSHQLSSHLATMALFSQLDPLPWIHAHTTKTQTARRVEWLEQITHQLTHLPADAIELQWQRWMRPYWQNRIDGVPRQMTTDEASAMAAWVMHLTSSISEGVNLATAHPAGLRSRGGVLRNMNNERVDRAPDAFAKLIAHLLRDTEPPFYGCDSLHDIVTRLRGRADPADIDAIIEGALRLGCRTAHQW
ncbi:SIR2 family protein [Nonomuraea endophytica]|uniref:SIR2 family protein n=1 Tax=Nonomuraea endophytica TaxID=714136 RepID=UPI0037CCA918